MTVPWQSAAVFKDFRTFHNGYDKDKRILIDVQQITAVSETDNGTVIEVQEATMKYVLESYQDVVKVMKNVLEGRG
jgi:hypothetical protein